MAGFTSSLYPITTRTGRFIENFSGENVCVRTIDKQHRPEETDQLNRVVHCIRWGGMSCFVVTILCGAIGLFTFQRVQLRFGKDLAKQNQCPKTKKEAVSVVGSQGPNPVVSSNGLKRFPPCRIHLKDLRNKCAPRETWKHAPLETRYRLFAGKSCKWFPIHLNALFCPKGHCLLTFNFCLSFCLQDSCEVPS